MPGRPKKRQALARVYETVPNLKQSRIGPSPRRTIRDRHPTWSVPNMRQQSITQMDALREYYHPNFENEGLETDDEKEESYVATPTRNKRRKVIPEKPHTRRIETRSTKRQAAKEEPLIQKQELQDLSWFKGREVKVHTSIAKATTASCLLPPKTPVSIRRKEIPSSQSPAETPFSIRSRQSLQDCTRSPLKEKSTNIDLHIKSSTKGTRVLKRLEVADSIETEDEDSPVPVRTSLEVDCVGPASIFQDITEEEPRPPSKAFAIHVDDFNERLKAAQRPVRVVKDSIQSRPRHEVMDSTDEEDLQEGAEAFGAGLETQAALVGTDTSRRTSDQSPETTPQDPKTLEDVPKLSHIPNTSELTDPHQDSVPPVRPSNLDDQPPMHKPKRVEFVNIASSDPAEPNPPSPLNERLIDSNEVSAQLLADFHRGTQPAVGLQTESQFEKGWTVYTPADDDIHSDLNPTSPPSPKPTTDQASSSLMTVPTQFIRPPIASPPKFYKAPVVPPSQATTVDVTQPSPPQSNLPPSSSQTITIPPQQYSPRKLPSPSQAYPSSSSSPPPPPISPPSSSSPLGSRKSDPWEGYRWDGVRLTDSQLLPDSLWNDSDEVGPPPLPGSSQEGMWDEEM